MESLLLFWQTTGLAQLDWGSLPMMGVGLLLLAVAIHREFEPVFVFACGFAILLANLPGSSLAEPGGVLYLLYELGVGTGLLPGLLCLGLGFLADFGPLLAVPALLWVGVAAQVGIFVALWLALLLHAGLGVPFGLTDAAAVGMIGGANLPGLVFFADRLAPDLLGRMVMVLYVGMALLPVIQAPIVRLLTTERERQVIMAPMRPVSHQERMWFPVVMMLPCLLLLPTIAPLLGWLAFGNLLRESGVVARFAVGSHATVQARLWSSVTLLLGLAVGGRVTAERFFSLETVAMFCLGMIALAVGSAAGLLVGKWLHRRDGQVNPLVGVAGLALVPLAARLANRWGAEAAPDPGRMLQHSSLLTAAMAANLAGVIGSIVVAGTLLATFGVK
ncbi:MAG: sodium ion-translocating decarboxylase subunit beta [Magnetococcus sp. DMHC-8]